MAGDEGDRDRAELAYLTTRLTELQAELRRNEAELGLPINDETTAQIVGQVCDILRGAGKVELAERCRAAIQRSRSAIERHATLIEQSASDELVSAARDAQDDALDLQRVDAEVDACLEALEGSK